MNSRGQAIPNIFYAVICLLVFSAFAYYEIPSLQGVAVQTDNITNLLIDGFFGFVLIAMALAFIKSMQKKEETGYV